MSEENKLGGFDKVHENFESKKDEFDVKEVKESKSTKVDFSKFSRTKKEKKFSSKFSSRFNAFLSNAKNLKIMWIIIFSITAAVLIVDIPLVIFTDKALKSGSGYMNFGWIINSGISGNIFAYISFATICLPYFLILTFFIVGINGVYKSTAFHIFTICALGFSLLCLLVSICTDPITILYNIKTPIN